MSSTESINNQKRTLEVAVADSLNLAAIFGMFLNEVLTRFLEEMGRLIMFPLSAAGSCIQAILAWRQAKLDQGENGAITRAIVETAGAIAITTAVAGSLLAATVFSVASPIIFTATVGAKALFHMGASIYYSYQWGKSIATSNPKEKDKYKAMAKSNAVGTLALTLATFAVGFVMLAAKPIVAICGVLAGLIGSSYALYKRCTMPKDTKSETNALKQPLLEDEKSEPSDSNRLNQEVSPKSTVSSTLKQIIIDRRVVDAAKKEPNTLQQIIIDRPIDETKKEPDKTHYAPLFIPVRSQVSQKAPFKVIPQKTLSRSLSF